MTIRNPHPCSNELVTTLLAALALSLSIGCSSSESAASANPQPAASAPTPQKTAAPVAAVPPVDACTLLSKADVEGVAGKSVLAGRKEDAGPMVMCSFDDPTAPQVSGRAISQVLILAVTTGQEGAYYKGPSSQAKDSLETARKNSASDEAVAGMGDIAYWDKFLRTLNVASGRYYMTVNVESRGDSLAVAKAAATKALAKLPK